MQRRETLGGTQGGGTQGGPPGKGGGPWVSGLITGGDPGGGGPRDPRDPGPRGGPKGSKTIDFRCNLASRSGFTMEISFSFGFHDGIMRLVRVSGILCEHIRYFRRFRSNIQVIFVISKAFGENVPSRSRFSSTQCFSLGFHVVILSLAAVSRGRN